MCKQNTDAKPTDARPTCLFIMYYNDYI